MGRSKLKNNVAW